MNFGWSRCSIISEKRASRNCTSMLTRLNRSYVADRRTSKIHQFSVQKKPAGFAARNNPRWTARLKPNVIAARRVARLGAAAATTWANKLGTAWTGSSFAYLATREQRGIWRRSAREVAAHRRVAIAQPRLSMSNQPSPGVGATVAVVNQPAGLQCARRVGDVRLRDDWFSAPARAHTILISMGALQMRLQPVRIDTRRAYSDC